MNILRTHTNNLISLLRRASIDSTNKDVDFSAFVGTVTAGYVISPEFNEAGTAAEAKLAAKAVKAPKVYEKDENGNDIRPKRGRPVGSRNKKTLAAGAAPIGVETAVTSTEVAPTEA